MAPPKAIELHDTWGSSHSKPKETEGVKSPRRLIIMSVASQRALDYLEGQPGIIFNRLYQQPSTALAIFRRMLPHLAKNLVMAMLFMPIPLAATDLETWVKPDNDSVRARDQSLNILLRLKVLEEIRNDQHKTAYQLNKAFRKSLRLALTGGGDHRSFGVPSSTADKNEVTIDFLDTFARQQWESILYYVVGSAGQGLGGAVNITAGTKELLTGGGFVVLRGRNAHITRDGFSFLLQETNAQIWTLLIEYLKLSERLQMDAVDVLSFLFTLGSLELGVSYTTENLTPTQLQMLDDLSDFGVVYRRSPDSPRYYPTRLATTLTSDLPALLNTSLSTSSIGVTPTAGNMAAPQETEKGYIIVETNYRLYAYTSSPLNISILSPLFAKKTRPFHTFALSQKVRHS
ncbi:TFIIH and nucleotide excision repair factor 3 complexes subunit, partial [Aureobasidium pullulans]